VRNEIFGPVAIVNTFKTEEEALAKANDSEYGLFAGVFTQDINKAMRIVNGTESGMVGVNCMSFATINAPFGGVKQSGVGRENGIDGLRGFTESKTVYINLNY
jgi:aldehyde dehydrogenase (NAD+)